jgi:hypothetical protein
MSEDAICYGYTAWTGNRMSFLFQDSSGERFAVTMDAESVVTLSTFAMSAMFEKACPGYSENRDRRFWEYERISEARSTRSSRSAHPEG